MFRKVIIVYFLVSLIVLASGYYFFSPTEYVVSVPIALSILLLVPIYQWYKAYAGRVSLCRQVNGRDESTIALWIFMLFALAMIVRIPSAILFDVPYEKTALIYLVVLTIVLVEKTELSLFGFKTKKLGKALLYGCVLFFSLTFLSICVGNFLLYLFIRQTFVESYSLASFLMLMPFMTLCVGISEEGFFRGYVQTHLEKFYSSRMANLLQAILFGFWHFVWHVCPFDPFGMFIHIISSFMFGMFFGYFYSKARNLAPIVLAHGLHNSFLGGIIERQTVEETLQTLSLANHLMLWLLPYTIAGLITFAFIKFLVKEI